MMSFIRTIGVIARICSRFAIQQVWDECYRTLLISAFYLIIKWATNPGGIVFGSMTEPEAIILLNKIMGWFDDVAMWTLVLSLLSVFLGRYTSLGYIIKAIEKKLS